MHKSLEELREILKDDLLGKCIMFLSKLPETKELGNLEQQLFKNAKAICNHNYTGKTDLPRGSHAIVHCGRYQTIAYTLMIDEPNETYQRVNFIIQFPVIPGVAISISNLELVTHLLKRETLYKTAYNYKVPVDHVELQRIIERVVQQQLGFDGEAYSSSGLMNVIVNHEGIEHDLRVLISYLCDTVYSAVDLSFIGKSLLVTVTDGTGDTKPFRIHHCSGGEEYTHTCEITRQIPLKAVLENCIRHFDIQFQC